MLDGAQNTSAADARELPPHGPANMLDLFMTRYDYDYNRDPDFKSSGDDANKGDGDDGDGISGDVRNRPNFAQYTGEWDGDTTYRVDYIPPHLRRKRGMRQNTADAAMQESAYMRDWYRPHLTANADGGPHPISVYKKDYIEKGLGFGGLPSLEGEGEGDKYAGAASVPYKADFLHAKGVKEDDGSDLPPKITSKDSLIPRHDFSKNLPAAGASDEMGVLPNRQPLLTTDAGLGPTDYYCTSWTYGDTSLAYPSQLPQGIEGSAEEGLLGTMDDKAELLRRLAGLPSATKKPVVMEDDTNPIFIDRAEQPRCAVSHRVEDEGHIKTTTYQSHFIDQSRLPELPGNHRGPADVRNTNTNHLKVGGEMTSGQLTRYSRDVACLRNSHGTLKKQLPEGSTVMPLDTFRTMRIAEKFDAVDKADPHRHKLK